jgi:hypothetical protein
MDNCFRPPEEKKAGRATQSADIPAGDRLGRNKMFVTIVCVCGQHNSVHDEDLDRAMCVRCCSPLLQPMLSQKMPATTTVVTLAPRKTVLAS